MPELETLIAGPEVAKAPEWEFWVTGRHGRTEGCCRYHQGPWDARSFMVWGL